MLKPRDGNPPLFEVLTWLPVGSELVSLVEAGGLQVRPRLLKLLAGLGGARRWFR